MCEALIEMSKDWKINFSARCEYCAGDFRRPEFGAEGADPFFFFFLNIESWKNRGNHRD